MKLAVSNIGWDKQDDCSVRELFLELGVQGIEIAPTKIWSDPTSVSIDERIHYARTWGDKDISIVGAQALLFGKPDLVIFKDSNTRIETINYLKKIISLVSSMGGQVLVFGSPKNRLIAGIPEQEVRRIGEDFFGEIAEYSEKSGCVFCIEPNPKEYGCDFILNSEQALDWVKRINHPGFGLHLDASSLILNNEPLKDSISHCSGFIKHFHISEPFLTQIGESGTDHKVIAEALAEIGYRGWVSIEMRQMPGENSVENIRNAVNFVKSNYLLL